LRAIDDLFRRGISKKNLWFHGPRRPDHNFLKIPACFGLWFHVVSHSSYFSATRDGDRKRTITVSTTFLDRLKRILH
jgi:hypothetical protein